MKITNKFRRFMSILLLVIILIGVMPLETYASANSMNAKMISFFQSGQENIEMSEISESELRVYGVFLSNFFTPGQTRIIDLSKKNENDNKLAKDISTIFFGNAGNSSRVGELNDLIYQGVKGSVRTGQLFDSGGNAITGKKLFSLMTEKGKIYDKNKQVVIDLSSDVFRGVFKILAAQSAGFMFNEEYGVAAMTGLYLDAFGNIWGSYEVTIVEGEAESVGETPTDKLVLVLPACLNPISFLNTEGKDLGNIKLPLNNSFAMGSLVDSDKISEAIITDGEVPYYNIPKYFGEGDKENALFIYGINSPFNNISNTNRISARAEEILKASSNNKEAAIVKMRNELENDLNSFYSNNNYSYVDNYKLMLGNRVDVVQKSLESGKTLFGDSSKHDLFRYFFDSMLIDLEKTYSTIYYFGEGGNASWANSIFDNLGMVGINMFGSKQENGKWLIHDSNQKLPKVADTLSSSREDLTIDGVRRKAGVDFNSKPTPFTTNSSALSTIDSRMITAINTSVFGGFGNYSILGKGYYIQGLDTQNDSEIYERMVDIVYSKIGNFSYKVYPEGLLGNDVNAMKENILYLNLHVYTVSGAKFKAEKTRTTNIEVFKTDSKPKTFVVTNNRVGTVANWPGIFWGYMVEMLDMENMVSYAEDGTPHYDIKSFESRYLPELPAGLVTGGGMSLAPLDAESGVSNSENLTFEETQKDLIKKIYGIISDGPNTYRDSWIKATLDGFIINTHRAITGSWISNIATVSSENESSYNSVVGYIHTPSLYDLPFTSWFMNNYMEIYILCLLIVLIITIAMVLLSMRTWKSGVLIFFAMSVCLMLPNILLENTINISNKVADSVYSDRFDFWAITQHQQSIKRLKGAVNTGTMDYTINYNAEKANTVYSQEAGVRIKWMAPKKTSMFNSMFTNENMSDKLATNLTIFKWLFSSFVYQQEFVSNDPFATYLYRPYNAIASDAQEFYKLAVDNIADRNKDRVAYDIEFTNKDNDEQIYEVNIPENIKFIFENSNTEYAKRYKNDFYGAAVWGDKELLKKDNIFKIYWSDDKYTDITEKTSQYTASATEDLIQKRNGISLWGLGNEDVTKIITQNGSLTDSSGPDIVLLDDNPKSPSPDTVELLGFYKHTESPFYYFYNTLKYRYSGSNGNGFKNALLQRDTFVVTDGKLDSTDRSASNKVRDFLDLEGLFTNIIPYMTMSNDYVYGWTNVHGTSVPDYDFSRADDSNNQTYAELKQLKTGMHKVWSMYSPWVDQLNSLDVHNEKIGIASKRVRVENTLNPSYYLKAGRPMIFSEADMIAKGYTQKELSDIERRIQRVLDTTYTDLQYLVNYYDMDDEVLITVAAMYATFNFNREFSQNSLFGGSVMLYPQGFEMKNFNYDAFMRLVMLNSTGETIFAENGDLYNRILSKTSFFTGLMLLITDILGVIIIPTMKIIILLLLLFLGLLLCLTCVMSPPEKLFKSISKSLLIPAILFLVSNTIFAFVVSLLVGEGLTSYVGSKGISITTNDPTITIGIMIIINAVYCVALFKIVKVLFNNCKSFGITTLQAGSAIIAGAALSGVKRVANSTKQVGSTLGGAVIGTTMAGKGNRIKGAMDGAVTGSKGGSVYQERRREQRMAEEQSKFRNITDEINKKASGKGKTGEISKPDTSNVTKSVKSEGLQKEKYSEDGNKLGNKVEDVVYTKNKVQDNVNRVKHSVVDKINTGYEDTKHKLQENMKTVQFKAQKTKSTAKDIVSGKYFNDALEQGIEKDKIYRTKKQELDSQRSKPSKRFNEEMDKMRKKGVNDTKGGKHNG